MKKDAKKKALLAIAAVIITTALIATTLRDEGEKPVSVTGGAVIMRQGSSNGLYECCTWESEAGEEGCYAVSEQGCFECEEYC